MNQIPQETLAGQSAIVTGGTSGIGKAIAKKLALHGAKVAIFGTNTEKGEAAVKEIRMCTGKENCIFLQVDVASTQEVELAIQKAVAALGDISILVNSAGITRDGLLMKMAEEDWNRVLEVNLKSCYNTTKPLLRSMIKARRGLILNITSVVGLMGNPGQVNYAASKAAIIGFTKALAKELASKNVLVNCIAPGFIETPMTEQLSTSQREAVLEKIPLKQFGTPEDVANVAYFLCSGLANYITGQVITVDGGLYM